MKHEQLPEGPKTHPPVGGGLEGEGAVCDFCGERTTRPYVGANDDVGVVFCAPCAVAMASAGGGEQELDARLAWARDEFLPKLEAAGLVVVEMTTGDRIALDAIRSVERAIDSYAALGRPAVPVVLSVWAGELRDAQDAIAPPVAPSFEGEREGATPDDELVAYRHRFCGGRVHLETKNVSVVGVRAICAECGDTDGLDLEAVVVAEPKAKASLDTRKYAQSSKQPGGQPAVGNDDNQARREAVKRLRELAKGALSSGEPVSLTSAELYYFASAFAERSEAPSPVLYDELREALEREIAALPKDSLTDFGAGRKAGLLQVRELFDRHASAAKRPCSPAPIPKED